MTTDQVLYHDLAAHYEAAQAQIRLLREERDRLRQQLREMQECAARHAINVQGGAE